MKRIAELAGAAALALALSGIVMRADAQETHIPRTQVDTMFEDIKASTNWDVNGNLVWSYYFTSTSKDALDAASKDLIAKGYTFIEVHALAQTAANPPEWELHLERVEHHTPDSLYARDEELYAFARTHPPVKYDGVDVGPIKNPTKP